MTESTVATRLGKALRWLSALAPHTSKTAAFVWLGLWMACLRYADVSASFVMLTMPFGIALFAMGPLELIPAHWHRLNFLVNALATMVFFASVMFAAVAVSYALPWEKSARGAFFVICWIVQLIVFFKAQPWMKRSCLHRLCEDRMVYSPPVAEQDRERH